MPNLIGEMFFTVPVGNREQGWSEAHYLTSAGTLPAALVDLGALANYRADLLGMGVNIAYLRVSDTAIFRDSQVQAGPVANPVPPSIVSNYHIVEATTIYNPQLATNLDTAGPQRGTGLQADFPEIGWGLRLEAGTTFKTRRWYLLRGNPDYVNETNRVSPQGAAWNLALQRFQQVLLNGKYGMYGINQATPLGVLPAVEQVAPFRITVNGLALAIGDQIRIRGVKSTSGPKLNGVWNVKNVEGNQITLFNYTGPTVITNANGTVQKRERIAIAYNKIVGRRWGKRNTGLPFDPVRGARRTRSSAA